MYVIKNTAVYFFRICKQLLISNYTHTIYTHSYFNENHLYLFSLVHTQLQNTCTQAEK